MAWHKGLSHPRRPGAGRPAGSKNVRSPEAQAVARGIVGNPALHQRWAEQALSGELSPQILQTLMYYAWGKPTEHVEHASDPDQPLVILFSRREED